MNQKLWAALGALLAAPLGALAQQSSHTPDPADPAAAVVPTVYDSAFSHPAPPVQEAQPTPDKTWRAANAALANPPAHAAHAAPEAGTDTARGKDAGPAAAVRADTSATPAVQPALVDHSNHHGMHHKARQQQ